MINNTLHMVRSILAFKQTEQNKRRRIDKKDNNTLKSDHMLCLFLFHIDYTIYGNHVFIKTTMSNKSYRTHYKI